MNVAFDLFVWSLEAVRCQNTWGVVVGLLDLLVDELSVVVEVAPKLLGGQEACNLNVGDVLLHARCCYKPFIKACSLNITCPFMWGESQVNKNHCP